MNPDPTTRVAPQVLPHLHLVADIAYPTIPQAHQQFVLDELTKAPNVANNVAFQWQFLDAPHDGTVLLVYQPPQRANMWASDGYTWMPEQYFRQQYGPFIVEMYIALHGYNSTVEPRTGPAVHCRQRYRLIGDPNNANKHGNPSLWLVHYKRSDRMEQAIRIPVSPQEAQSINARNYLKGLGHLQEKKFMLADAPNWPAVTLPEAAQQHNALTFVGGQMANRMHMHIQQQQQQAYARDHGPSPKRARHGTNTSQRPTAAPQVVPQFEMDEEDIAESDRRDVFDILTQRDISMMRFRNHEEWMEELFSGYATFDIKPVDLAFDRAGFMQPITDGFFSRPDRLPTPPGEAYKQTEEHYDSITAKPLGVGKTKEFARAVEKRIADNNAQIAEMKRIHDERVKSLEKGSFLREAAAKIRGELPNNARPKPKTSEESTSSTTESQLSMTSSNGDDMEEVSRRVESSLGKTIVSRHEINLVQKGGLVEESSSLPKLNAESNDNRNGNSNGNGVDDGNTEQMASLFDDFLETNNSAETSNKPSASPQPIAGSNAASTQQKPGQPTNTGAGTGEDWVMVQKPNPASGDGNASFDNTNAPADANTANEVAADDDIGGDMIDFNTPADDDTAHHGNAFDEAMHFDAMDSAPDGEAEGSGGVAAEGSGRIEIEGSTPTFGAENGLETSTSAIAGTGIGADLSSSGNVTGQETTASPFPPTGTTNPAANETSATAQVEPQANPTTQVEASAAPAAAENQTEPPTEPQSQPQPQAEPEADTVMDLMDDSAFGDAFPVDHDHDQNLNQGVD